MTTPRLTCDRELLRQSLDDRLSESQEEVLIRHLAECPACQQELERLAAEQTEWSRVAEALRREAAASGIGFQPVDLQGRHDRLEACPTPADFAVAFLEPSKMPGALGRLGDIDILEVIGHGGMGIVLKGFQQELHRPVAVKVLAPHLAASGAARQRFAREARATAVVVHPNVMPVLTVHSSGKLPYLVMPYVPCESLQQRLDRQGWLETLNVVRIAWQVSCGLAAAHAQGLVHRDIKPANMLLEQGVERVMLTDFGLARAADDASLTRTGVIAGTPQYMSPEQARGESVDARSDLFSLGSVLYAMCTGRPPFRAETSYGILRRITDTEPRPIREINPAIPEWLVAIIAKLHAKHPAERFASADELAKLLEQCLAHVQQPTAVPLPEAVAALSWRAGDEPQSRGLPMVSADRRKPPMEYSITIPFRGDAGKAFDAATTILTTNGFAITDRRQSTLEFTGPGLRSTRQNPLLGASRIRIGGGHAELSLDAELGGVAGMRRFLTIFPLAMAAGFAAFFGLGMGFMFGRTFGVGFGVPFAPGWRWFAFIAPIAVLPLAPWLFLSPMFARSIRSRTLRSLDTLLSNISVAAGDGTAAEVFRRPATATSPSGLDDDANATRTFWRTLLIFGSFITGLIVLAAAVGIADRFRKNDVHKATELPAEAAVSAEPSISANDAKSQPTMSTWQDGVAEQIHGIREATDQLETSAERLWDNNGAAAASNRPTNSVQPSEEEVTK